MDQPHTFFLYLLLLVALAIGFFLGRRERRPSKPQSVVIKDYYQGLNFLLGDRPELGVDRFIQAMEVSDESIDVHLALAGVVRRRGEVDKAIRIHQNLLASPVLSRANKQLVEFELARDYHAAGLLDRAEALLIEITSRRDAQEKAALNLLVDIYEQEREWSEALRYGKRLGTTEAAMRNRLSHFHCELADNLLRKSALRQALDAARSAVQMESGNPRAHWLSGRIELAMKRHKRALKHLQRTVELQHDLIVEVLVDYAKACQSLGLESEYMAYLEENLAREPHARVLKALIDYRRLHGIDTEVSQALATVQRAPDVKHLPVLLDLLERADEAQAVTIRQLLQQIVVSDLTYQCGNCGFRSQHHSWHCPTCKAWGSFSAADGVKEVARA